MNLPAQSPEVYGTCGSCGVGCGVCIYPDANNCSSCLSPFKKHTLTPGVVGTCDVSCPNGTFESGLVTCQTCDPACKRCYGPGTSMCQECNQGYFYLGSNQCSPCHTSCLTCLNNSACVDCKPNLTKQMSAPNQLCYAICGAQTYFSSLTLTCVGCDPFMCINCGGPHPGCLNCWGFPLT